MTFKTWFDAGFTDLIPVIPPDARLNAFSKVRADQRGKVPGTRRAQGDWIGMRDWTTRPTTAQDCAEWEKWYRGSPSIGLRATHFPALDIDVEVPEVAEAILGLAAQHFGASAVRRREGSSKCLIQYVTDAPFKRMRLWFKHPSLDKAQLVEVLGDGNHYLIEGMHQSGTQYRWDDAPDARPITAESAADYLSRASGLLAFYGCTDIELEGSARAATERAEVPQPELEAPSAAALADIVGCIPNTTTDFPSRDDYLKVGYACKASLPRDPEVALSVWQEWCGRWEGNDRAESNDPEVVAGDWARLHPPFALGYPYLLDLARAAGVGTATEDFADICETAPPPLPPDPEADGAVPYSDAWLARRVLRQYGEKLRYNANLGGWLFWDGKRWAADEGNIVSGWMAAECRVAGRDALKGSQDAKGAKLAFACASNNVRKNVQAYATTDPRINVPVEAFDADPWALNTPHGIVDLRTGAVLPADPGRLFTRCTAVTPTPMPTPRWDKFLREVTGGDSELEAYLQKLAGYSLTGSTREHMLAFLWGPGGNGKGVFLNALVRVFGSYASVAAMDTFTSSRFDRHPAELAALVGARLVTAQETQEGRSWDEAKVKAITGGDPITARFMRQNFFTYLPQFKLLFAGNHKPHILNLDDAMRRRFHLVPFTERPSVPDQVLPERLQAEWSGILQWAVDGCVRWQAEGLIAPKVVVDATEMYFVDEDAAGRWLFECTDVLTETEHGTTTHDLYNSYRRWCLEQNEKPSTQRAFIEMLQGRGFERWRHPKTRLRGVSGITLRDALHPLPPLGSGGATTLH